MHLLSSTPPHAQPAMNTNTSKQTHIRLYSSHFWVAAAMVYGGTNVCISTSCAISACFMSGIKRAASFVHIETTNTLFHVKSTLAPGKTRVTSACSSAYTTNWTTVPVVRDDAALAGDVKIVTNKSIK